MNNLATIPLQNGIIYGPVRSRRLGRSLGINILPTFIKTCSMDCLYCQYSWTGRLTDINEEYGEFPDRFEIRDTVERMLPEAFENGIDFITFSGNGETTLHPDFPAIVDDMICLRNRYAPSVKISILSNSTTIFVKPVREAILLLDTPIMKWDTGIEKTFIKLNRPASRIKHRDIFEGLKAMNGKLVVQSLFVEGHVSNTTEEEIKALIESINEIKPIFVQVYSLDRGPADRLLSPASPEKLGKIAAYITRETGIRADVY